jgi:hypothetical protein
VDAEQVMQALGQFSEVFSQLPPYQQKELVRLVVHRVELAEDCMKMALYGRVPAIVPVCAQEGVSRCQTSNWLPGLVSQSVVLWDGVGLLAKHVAKGHTQVTLQSRTLDV